MMAGVRCCYLDSAMLRLDDAPSFGADLQSFRRKVTPIPFMQISHPVYGPYTNGTRLCISILWHVCFAWLHGVSGACLYTVVLENVKCPVKQRQQTGVIHGVSIRTGQHPRPHAGAIT